MPTAPNAQMDSTENINTLLVVLRETMGEYSKDTLFRPWGPAKATLEDGKEIEVHMAHFGYLADMHIRFVFDAPTYMRNLTANEFKKLNLTPQETIEIAVKNLKRLYGKPRTSPWEGELTLVEGDSPDLNSSYFFDTEFWQDLLKMHPEGLVVGVPKRGGLLYTPFENKKAVEDLKKSINYLFTSSEEMRVSSALYLFKDNKWSVFQEPKK